MKLFIFSLLAFLSLPFICYSTLDSEELNGFLKDFARNKPLGYSIKHFTEKLLEEVMKLALRDTLLKSGNLNAVPTLKMVTLLDYPSLSDFFLKMNISSNSMFPGSVPINEVFDILPLSGVLDPEQVEEV